MLTSSPSMCVVFKTTAAGVFLAVLLLAFLIAVSLCQLLLHLVTGGRARPVTQRELFTGFISFMGVVFGSVLLNLWRGLQQIVTPGPTNATPRRRRSTASTSATPGAGGMFQWAMEVSLPYHFMSDYSTGFEKVVAGQGYQGILYVCARGGAS